MQRSLVWPVLALAGIWIAVAIISLSDSEIVYGADQDAIPIVALVTWIWGAIASALVLAALVQRRQTRAEQRHAWIALAMASVLIWGTVTILALVIPEFSFDLFDDPVVIPIGALLAPGAGVAATAIACQYVPGLTDVAYSDPPA